MRLGKGFRMRKKNVPFSQKNLYILFAPICCASSSSVAETFTERFALSFIWLLFILSALKLNNAECTHSIRNTTRKIRASRKTFYFAFRQVFFVDVSNSIFRSQSVLTHTHTLTQHPCGHSCTSFWCIQLDVSILQCELVPYTFLLFSIYSTINGCFQASVFEAGAGARRTSYVIEFLPPFFNVESMRIIFTMAPLNTVANGIEKFRFTTKVQSYFIYRFRLGPKTERMMNHRNKIPTHWQTHPMAWACLSEF